MKSKLFALLVLLAIMLGFASGCGTIRGGAALIGGVARDISQGAQHVIDHTNTNEAPTYGGHR